MRAAVSTPALLFGSPWLGAPAVGAYASVMRLNQVTVGCTDYAASARFYETLGLTRIVDAPPRYARFETPGGETLSLHAVDAVSSTTVVYFEVDDVDAVVLNLTAKGLVFDQLPRDERWLWREARLRDPAGNEICIFHAGENRRFPPWRVERAEPA
jgi:catechol 2,3-dioxygenase-like lactoylglutathione lyase family enzyme